MRFVLPITVLALSVACSRRPDTLPPRPDEIPTFADDACREPVETRVSCTLDGDTFDVGGSCGEFADERVRMLGINAPEIEHDEPAECYGDIAAAALAELLTDQTVTLSFDFDCTDRYGRSLAYVWIGAGGDEDEDEDPEGDGDGGLGAATLINEILLLQGYARLAPEDWSSQPLHLQERFQLAEESARTRGAGLWSACEAGS